VLVLITSDVRQHIGTIFYFCLCYFIAEMNNDTIELMQLRRPARV